MAIELAGKAALVTGGGRGIGFAFVQKLLDARCQVAIVDRALHSSAQELLETHHESVFFHKTDVTDWNGLQAAFDATMDRFGRLDVVCPAAGIFEPVSCWTSSLSAVCGRTRSLTTSQPGSRFWEFKASSDGPNRSSYNVLDINLTHPIRCTQLAIDLFLRQNLGHGVVINTTSCAAQLTATPIPLYVTSKAALSHFVRSMEVLEPACNIRVNAVAPGMVRTALWDDAKRADWIDEEKDRWVSADRVAGVMVDLVTKPEYVGGSVWEIALDSIRRVGLLNDPGPDLSQPGISISNLHLAQEDLQQLMAANFGK